MPTRPITERANPATGSHSPTRDDTHDERRQQPDRRWQPTKRRKRAGTKSGWVSGTTIAAGCPHRARGRAAVTGPRNTKAARQGARTLRRADSFVAPSDRPTSTREESQTGGLTDGEAAAVLKVNSFSNPSATDIVVAGLWARRAGSQ